MKNRLKIIQESVQSILNEMETYRTYTHKKLGGIGEYPNTPVANRFALEFVRKALENRREGFKSGITSLIDTTRNLSRNRSLQSANYRIGELERSRWATAQRFVNRKNAINLTLGAIDDRISSLPRGDVL